MLIVVALTVVTPAPVLFAAQAVGATVLVTVMVDVGRSTATVTFIVSVREMALSGLIVVTVPLPVLAVLGADVSLVLTAGTDEMIDEVG